MSTSTNQVSGLVSGFDWASMIDQLVAIEHQRIDLVENQQSDYSRELSEWQTVNTKLLALKTAAEALKDADDFYLYKTSATTNSTSVDAEDLISVSADTDAALGSYTIKVTNLATAQKLSSNPFTSQSTELGSAYVGDVVINGRVITVGATDTLADVAYSVNQANTGENPTGVTASIVSYSENDFRLVLTSDTTGEEGISLLNGSSVNLVQKFGWKDNQTAAVKNSITNGAQSEQFTAPNVAVQSLLGLLSGEASSGSLTIDGIAVTIDLSTMSLTEIKDAINDASISGVTASVISQTVDGTTYYRLQIDGTQTFEDENNILNTLGILDHTSVDVTGVVSANGMTTEGSTSDGTTLLKDIDGYNLFTSGGYSTGDYITLSGTDTDNVGIGTVHFDISSTTTVGDLLDEIESRYGDVVAYVTSDGTIQVDDLTGGSSLSVSLNTTLQDTGSQLDFGVFGASVSRKREVIAGEDATVEIDGVTVTSSSNVIDDVIAGVTLTLVNEDDSTTATLNVERDLGAVKSNIETFVDSYNEIASYINAQFAYDTDSEETGGVLFGDSTLRSVKSDLASIINEDIWGVADDFSSLLLIGIESEVDDDNNLSLTIDDDVLTAYLETNFSDVMALFAGQGTTSSNTINYVGHTRDTQTGEYNVYIYQAATKGSETGETDLSAGGSDETLTITQGGSSAEIAITSDMTIDDIVNEINAELDNTYAQTVVGDELLYADGGASTAITSNTTWDSIYDSLGTQLSFSDGDTISFSGDLHNGNAVTGSYQIDNVSSDTVQDLLSAIEDAFGSDVTATIDTSGRLVITDENEGTSQLTIDSISTAAEGEFFGTVDVTTGADDGSRQGRYAMAVTATDDDNGHLVLTNSTYGISEFTISQDTSDGDYDFIKYADTANTTKSTGGTVYIDSSTTWSDVHGADAADGDTITISGKARDGGTDISGTYTITDASADTLEGLLTAIETAYSNQGTTVDAFLLNGKIYVEDLTAGTSAISLTLAPNNQGGGSLNLGTFDPSTERDLDLGFINGIVNGLDVAGTIDGESATGSGQLLTGDDGNVNTDGLAVRYSGTAGETTAGTIKLTFGVAELLDRILFDMTDSYEGYVAFKQDSLQDTVDRMGDQIEEMEARLDRKTATLITKYVAMELTLSELQNQSTWLNGQLNALMG
jgi:flagellar hook-associated protein 2